ncbi:MAG: hypothetical protein JWL70_2362 [Acidimicrobiia bacterium]|nr:hypothetical protein [Acidimicrobiia bacterium]
MIVAVTNEQLTEGWGIAWRAALVTSVSAVALALALRWFLPLPQAFVVITAAAGGLMVGWRLPPARIPHREKLRSGV